MRRLLEAGLGVYLIDWGDPDDADRHTDLEDYIEQHLGGCVRHVLAQQRQRGARICSGCARAGVLSLCYTALHPEQVARPRHAHHPGRLPHPRQSALRWVRGLDTRTPRRLRQRARRGAERAVPRPHAVSADAGEVRAAAHRPARSARGRGLRAHGALDLRQSAAGGRGARAVRALVLPGERLGARHARASAAARVDLQRVPPAAAQSLRAATITSCRRPPARRWGATSAAATTPRCAIAPVTSACT